ncbi:MAG: hypothetical protein ACYS6K_01220 [Planctomycetota bacterium]
MSVTNIHIRAHRIDRNAVNLDRKKIEVRTLAGSKGIGDNFGPGDLTGQSELQQADKRTKQDYRHVDHKSIRLSVQHEFYK